MTTNKKRSPQEWQQIIEAQQESGPTIADFCQHHNVSHSTFIYNAKKSLR